MVIRRARAGDDPPVVFPVSPAGFAEALAHLQRASGDAPASAVLVGIEPAGTHGLTLAQFLVDRGIDVVFVSPLHTRRWQLVQHGVPLKTDAHDASTILALVAQGTYAPFPFANPAYADLRALVHARERVTADAGRLRNQICAVLDSAFPEALGLLGGLDRASARAVLARWPVATHMAVASVHDVSGTLATASLHHLGDERAAALVDAARSSLALRAVQPAAAIEVPQLLDRLELLRTHLARLNAELADRLAALPAGRALLELDEVSITTAAAILGEIGDPQAYRSVRQVMRLAGLSLVERSSGTAHGSPHRPPGGRATLRRHLYMLAVRSIRRAAADARWRQAHLAMLARNGGATRKAITALMRRWLRRCFGIARLAAPTPGRP
jgi:transposase